MSAHALGQLLLGLAAVIALARLLGTLAKLAGQPPVIGEILAGVLVGPTFFGTAISGRLFPAEILPALSGLANVGLVLFMFVIGYELDQRSVRGFKRVASSVSIGSIVLPFGLGIVLATWLARHHQVPRLAPFALFIGAAMSVTAFPVLARILSDRGMLRTEIGGLALASGAVDDVVAWSLLAVVVAIGGANGPLPWQLLLFVPYLLVMLLWVRPMLRRLADTRERIGRLTPNILGTILVGLLLSCFVTESLGLHAIFGAFLFGAVMPRAGGEALRHEILERLEQVSVLLLLPVFFVLAGLRVDLSTMDGNGLIELVLILLVAITGKFVGAFTGARLHRVGSRRAAALATLMNTRGLTEIVILTVGLQLGILDGQLFSMMVVMALVTTAMAGPLLSLIYPRRLVDRDVIEAQRAALRITDAYRVLALVPSTGSAAPLVELAADLAEPRRPAEVVLSRLLPYPTAPIEVGSGLSSELLAMTQTMGELARLAEPIRARGMTAPVLARFTTDPAHDLTTQILATEPDVLVVTAEQLGHPALREGAGVLLVTLAAQPPAPPHAVFVRATGNAHGEAALQVGAQLAAVHAVELVVDAGPRLPRRFAAAVQELNRHAIAARVGSTAPQSALMVAADGAAAGDAHLLVRAERHAPRASAAQWVHRLVASQ